MWIGLALLSAFFAGITSILAKCGIRKTGSHLATALRTVVVLAFAWLMAALTGGTGMIGEVDAKSWAFLALSGIATGASWLCYFKALQSGDINKVVPVDKLSVVMTLLMAFVFLKEPLTPAKGAAVVLIGVGTFLMIQKKQNSAPTARGGYGWLMYALLSAIFASLTAILGKVGITGVESNLGTAIRTSVVFVMAWLVVFATGEQRALKHIDRRELGFILLSGLTTGASWLCYYAALKDGAASVVVPIDKLSILVTVAFSALVFKERLSRRAAVGLGMIVLGTGMMLL